MNPPILNLSAVIWIQVLAVFLPLVYIVVYTIVSAYRNVKLYCQRTATTPDLLAQRPLDPPDSIGFPARLIEISADYDTF